MNKNITGLILAGGKSSRMGFDKSKIKLHGIPVIDVLHELLNPFCDQVVISCKPENPPKGKYKLLFDEFPFDGPLNGIATALKSFPENDILVAAADQPFIIKNDLTALLAQLDLNSSPAIAFVNGITKNPEPFPSLWKQSALPALNEFLKNNKPSPMDFIRKYGHLIMNSTNPDFAVNINYPEDLKNFHSLTGL